MKNSSVTGIYEAHAETLRARYDSVETADVLAPVADLLPTEGDVLDVGAGSGRDAAWFLARGHRVTVAEPVAVFRAAIAVRAPEAVQVEAHLPELTGVQGEFGVILVGALWHHLPEPNRDSAFSRLAGLLAPSGRLFLSLRHGPVPVGFPIHPLDAEVEIARARVAGLELLRSVAGQSQQQENIAAGINWTWLVLAGTRQAQ